MGYEDRIFHLEHNAEILLVNKKAAKIRALLEEKDA